VQINQRLAVHTSKYNENKNCEEVRNGINFIEGIGETESGDFAYVHLRQGKITIRAASSTTDDGFISEKDAKNECEFVLEDINNPQELKNEYNSIENAVQEILYSEEIETFKNSQ